MRSTRRILATASAVLCAIAVTFTGGATRAVAATTTGSYHPATINGMNLRDAYLKLRPADGGPVVVFSGSEGTGMTELQAVSILDPAVVSSLSPSMTTALSNAHVGSQFNVTVLTALNPNLNTCITGCSSCPDTNNCDYFYANFGGSTGFNSVGTTVNDEADAYRDNGDSTVWSFLNEQYVGTDQPFSSGTNDWSSSVQPCGSGSYTSGPAMVYYDGECGNGSWNPVSGCFLCISIPPGIGFRETIDEDIYNAYCISETEIFASGGSSQRNERAYWHVTESAGASYSYGDYGLNIGNC